ncbi:MAG: hypothetical protein HYZ87_01610, partial [Candidatus Omnitrophica bacterium]|nr:hypothetical protein [Candidatus Omnitrophota bacterium]
MEASETAPENKLFKSRYGLLPRSIVLLLLAAFFFQEVAHAAPSVESFSHDIVRHPAFLKLPNASARIEEVHEGPKGRLIIHIQDAHTNTSAQKNISAILEELITRYQVKTVFVEGGTRDDSLDFLRPLAPKSIRERVSKKYLSAGELNGVEYLSLGSDYDMEVRGVEDSSLYQKNLETYASIVSKREKILEYLGEITRRLPALKKKFYPAGLFQFDETRRRFENKESDFTEYYEELVKRAPLTGTGLLGFPNILLLKNLKALESAVDFDKANAEQEGLLKVLSEKDPESVGEIREFLGSLTKLKFHSQPPLFFYENLLISARKAGVPKEATANLAQYTEYLKLYASVDMTGLLAETKALEREIFKTSLTEEDANTLYEIDAYLSLLKNLFSLEITAENFNAYFARKADVRFETVMMLAFLNRKLYDLDRASEV